MTDEKTGKPAQDKPTDPTQAAHEEAARFLTRPRPSTSLLHAANEKRAKDERAAIEAQAVERLEDLRADRVVLDDWISDLRTPIESTESLAASVRAKSQDLVDLPEAQGQARWSMERTVDALVQDLIKQTGLMKPIGRYDFPKGLETVNGLDLMDPSNVMPADMDASFTRAAARSQIQEQIDAIRSVPQARVPAFNADLQAAERMSRRAQLTADAALSLSARRFVRHRTPSPTPGASGAAASFIAFIGVAAAGSVVPPARDPSILAIVILIAISAAATGLLIRDGRGRGVVAAGAAGVALASFMAAYLATNLIDPNAISIDGHPMGFIGEAALLSLTVAVSGGTIGVSLAGIARAVAFVQILFTVAAVGVALTWGWNRLVARVEVPETPDNV